MLVTNHKQKFYAIQRANHNQQVASSHNEAFRKKKKAFHRMNFVNNMPSQKKKTNHQTAWVGLGFFSALFYQSAVSKM